MNHAWESFLNEKELRAAGIVICIDKSDNFLIIRRSNIDKREGQWTIPGGHIDDSDNSIEDGAVRELKEETDLDCAAQDVVFIGEPKPQKYYFVAKKWSGSVNVLIPNPKSGEIEHDDYKWVSIEDIKDIENTEIPIYLLEKALEVFKNE